MKIALMVLGGLVLLGVAAMAVFVFYVQNVETPAYRETGPHPSPPGGCPGHWPRFRLVHHRRLSGGGLSGGGSLADDRASG